MNVIRFLQTLALLLVLTIGTAAAAHAADDGSVAGASSDTSSSDSYGVSWSLLDPGDDWAANTIRAVFPVLPNSSSSTNSPGKESTVIGTMLGWMSGFVMAIAMSWVTYTWFITSHRAAETGELLGRNQSAMAIVKMGIAAVLMFPFVSGFNGAQAVVVQSSLWGIGMAKTVYQYAVEAIGPDGKAIAQPVVPGTKGIVLNLVKDEFCRALINTASNNATLIATPTGRVVRDLSGSATGVVNYSYDMALGDGTPTCGAIQLMTPNANTVNLAGVSVDQASMQKNVLDSVLSGDIRGPVQTVAQNFWQSKRTADLAPLMTIVTNATNDYTARLTQQAATLRSQMQAAVAKQSASFKDWGLTSSDANADAYSKIDSLGWSSAGAYYLEFSRLNGQTLSLMTATPTVTTPSYSGLGSALSSDVAPLLQSELTFLQNIDALVATNDGMNMPGGSSSLYSGAMPGGEGTGIISRLFSSLNLNDAVLRTVIGFMEPSGTDGYWTDPFGNLMSLGNWMITTAVATMGTASILSSTAGSIGSGLVSLMAGQPEGLLAAGIGHVVMQFFSTPIMIGCMGMLIPGLTIAFVLPMVPYVMWIAGIASWLILVCEAMIAAPLWMLAHMSLNGEGLHGAAKAGYALLFNVMFRPVLMLFGLFLGYFVFDAMSWLVHQTFGVAAAFALSNGWFVTNFLGMLVLVAMFVMIHTTLALMCFRLIAIVPDRVPQMIGFGDGARIDMDQFSRDAAVIGMAGALQNIGRAVQGEDGKKKEGENSPSKKMIARGLDGAIENNHNKG